MVRSAAAPTDTSTLRAETLVAARRLIAERGHRDVSMRDIAGDVGCSVSSLYFHFDSRDALIHALIDEGFSRWHDEVRGIVDAEPDPWRRLDAIARRYVADGLGNPAEYEIMYMFNPRSMKRLPRDVFRRVRRGFDLWADNVQACVPGASPEEARVTVAAIWATLHGAVSTLLTERLDTRIARDRYIEAVITAVHATVKAAAA